MNRQEAFILQEKWLTVFENSSIHWLLNTDVKDSLLRPKNIPSGVVLTHLEAFNLNYDNPVSHCYTPNGNFAEVNLWRKTWEKSSRTEKEAQQVVYAFPIDIDKKSPGHASAKEYTRDDIIAMIKRERMPIQYFTETPGGWHLYMFVNPADRKRIDKNMYSDLQQSFTTRFDADELKDMARLMRIPFSMHYSSWEPVQWKLFSCAPDWDGEIEVEEVTRPDQIRLDDLRCLTFEQLTQYREAFNEKVIVTNTSIQDKFFDKAGGSSDFISLCNQLPIQEVMGRMSKYPHIYKEYTEYPVIDGLRINFSRWNSVTGESMWVYETDWYRIWAEKNCAHDLSVPQKDIQVRPRWEPYAFVYHWFHGNSLKMYEFFEEEFGIFRRTDKKELYLSIEAPRGVIDFTVAGVTYNITIQKEWRTHTKIVSLMHKACYPKWVVYTKVMMGKWETEQENRYILLSNDKEWDILIPYHTDKRNFNKTHGTHGIQFIADEVSMNDFYQAIWDACDAGIIPKMWLQAYNGFEKFGLVYGKQIITPEANTIMNTEFPGLHFANQNISLMADAKIPIDVVDYYQQLLWLFPRRISLVALTGFISGMLGENFWHPVICWTNTTKIIPPIFLSWETKAGKSTLSLLIKEWFWMSSKDRVVAIKSITPQPLQQACSDNIVMHLEEFTGNIPKDMEWILRDVINKNSKQRWNIDGSNTVFNFRSNLLIDGEQLPQERSLQNRMVIIPFFSNDKCWTNEQIIKLRQHTYLYDLVRRVYANWKEADTIYMEWVSVMNSLGFDHRDAQLYAFLFLVNRIFGLEPDQVFCAAIMENVKALEAVEKPDALEEILSMVIFDMKIMPTIFEWPTGNYEHMSIPLPAYVQSAKRISLIEATRKFPGAVTIDNSCLILKYNMIDSVTKRIEKYSHRAVVRSTGLTH